MNSSVSKTAEMTKIALLVAMNCVSAYIIIPLPFSMSPIALQTMFVNLVAFLLTPRQTFMTMFVYILIGLAGIPVFTGGTGEVIWSYRRLYFWLLSCCCADFYAARQRIQF